MGGFYWWVNGMCNDEGKGPIGGRNFGRGDFWANQRGAGAYGGGEVFDCEVWL
jgi:hypothetical protein